MMSNYAAPVSVPTSPPFVRNDQANNFGNNNQTIGDLIIQRIVPGFTRFSVGSALLDLRADANAVNISFGANVLSVGGGGTTGAGNFGIHGHAPVPQGAAIAAAPVAAAAYTQVDQQAMIDAINALRATLTAHGITA